MAADLKFNDFKASNDERSTQCHALALTAFKGVNLVHLDETAWAERMQRPSAHIFAASVQDAEGEKSDQEPVALLLTREQTHPEIGYPTIHVSIAAVHPSWQGRGLFARLLQQVERHHHDREQAGVKGITICTYPKHIPHMYSILSRSTQWEEVCMRDKEEGEQALFIRVTADRAKKTES